MKRFFIGILLIGAFLILSSCNNEESFSLSKDNRLVFSTDTLSLDTLFSNTSSSTYEFWLYNRNTKGVRLASVKLANGNQKGFRVNVNGIPLSNNNGFRVNAIPVYHGDSLCVFVEATAPSLDVIKPQEFDDEVVFTLESGVEQRVKLRAWSWQATYIDRLEVANDTIIDSPQRPILCSRGIKIYEGATLRIKGGTAIYFNHDAGIDVLGRLSIEGESEKRVLLRGSRLDKMFSNLPYDHVSGQWQGLHFYGSSYQNTLSYVDIRGCFNGIVCDSSDINRAKIKLEQATIHNCQGYGVRLINCKAELINTQLSNTLHNCLSVEGADVLLNACTLAQYYPFDSSRGEALHISSQYQLTHLSVLNSIVTGFADEQIKLPSKGSSNLSYQFLNSLLRTTKPKEKDLIHYKDVVFESAKDTINMGENLFIKVDNEALNYDFHLKNKAFVIGKADKNSCPQIDHDGIRRKSVPDMGAFEHH